MAEAPLQPAGDEDRLPPVGDAEPRELVDRGGERDLARVAERARQGQRVRLDHERDARRPGRTSSASGGPASG